MVNAELHRQPRQMTLFCVRNADLTVDFRKFFTELGRHNVSPATVIHAVTNWRRLIQIAPRVLPFFDTPNQVATPGDDTNRKWRPAVGEFELIMETESESHLRLEIGHVLFIDLVGYSKLLTEEQNERLRQLTDIVLATGQVVEATNEKLVRLPTGDGMALVFRNTSEEPAQCALEIAQALKEHPEIKVRMGVHSGPVSEVTDLNGRTNIAGAGINLAQRVMDCGDAGHILLSKRVADDLEEYRNWRPLLHDLGECEVKHGLKVSIVNLFTDQAGNPEPPRKISRRAAQRLAKRAPLKGRAFFAELRRRNVYRAGVIYAMAAWLLIQVATQVFPFFEIPNWVVRLIVVVLVIGFPVALALAWAFEITPEGIVKTDDVPPEKSIRWQAGRKLDFVIIGILAVAIGFLLFLRFSPSHQSEARRRYSGEKHRRFALRKLQRRQGKRLFRRRHPGRSADQPGENQGPHRDQPHQRDEVSRRRRARHQGNRQIVRRGQHPRGKRAAGEGSGRGQCAVDRRLQRSPYLGAALRSHARGFVRLGRRTGDGDRGRLARPAHPGRKSAGRKRSRPKTRTPTISTCARSPTSRGPTRCCRIIGAPWNFIPRRSSSIRTSPSPMPGSLPPARRFIIFTSRSIPGKTSARSEAEAALRLQPDLGEAHFALGQCAYWFDDDYERALREFAAAQKLFA